MSVIISLTNQKGGVGKTSSALNLGAALKISGMKVLVIDNDPKCRIRHLGSYAEKKEMPRN